MELGWLLQEPAVSYIKFIAGVAALLAVGTTAASFRQQLIDRVKKRMTRYYFVKDKIMTHGYIVYKKNIDDADHKALEVASVCFDYHSSGYTGARKDQEEILNKFCRILEQEVNNTRK